MTHFLIADTFTDSLARLTGDEQKAAKTTAFDLQLEPSLLCCVGHHDDSYGRAAARRVERPLSFQVQAVGDGGEGTSRWAAW